MKIWISKNSEVPVSDQLIAQITLGIAAGDLKHGEKIPSTREVARRCGVHPNTVGAVYRKLADQNLLEFRQGSGFYVAQSAGKRIEGSRRLDELIEGLLEAARTLGFSQEEVRKRLKKTHIATPTDRVILIESDPALRDILVYELAMSSVPVQAESLETFSSGQFRRVPLLTAMLDEKPKIDHVLSDGQRCIYLKGRSVSAAMSAEKRPSPDDLIAVVSGWAGFLTFARIMLLAAKIDPGNLIVRSTADDDWERAVRPASIIISDSLTATYLDGRDGVRSFPLISDESIADLRAALQPE